VVANAAGKGGFLRNARESTFMVNLNQRD